MEAVELHDDLFMKIFWDESTRIIGSEHMITSKEPKPG
jgi:hypothetical protein